MFCNKIDFLIMTYENIAYKILEDAIKSSVYIDEKAREFFQPKSEELEDIVGLSEKLYENFKVKGISLDILRYKVGDEINPAFLKYITDNRDLVLLDWHLKDQSGEEESLKILKEVVYSKNVHFAVVYTSESRLENVLKNILLYFSGLKEEDFKKIKEASELYLDEVDFSDFHDINFNRFDIDIKKRIGILFLKYKSQLVEFKKELGFTDNLCAIIKASLVNLIEPAYLSPEALTCPSHIDFNNNIVVINNTIVLILEKKNNSPADLLENFKQHIIKDVDSFNTLLSLDFYNHIYKSSVITNDNDISFPKEAILSHRKKLIDTDSGEYFNKFIDEILLEKIAISMRDRKSDLLSNAILNQLELSSNLEDILDSDIKKMNVFYNSFKLDKENQYINFGDVFEMEGSSKFLICITPLCDCIRPQEKMKSNYFFAEGSVVDFNIAKNIGENAFISYLDNKVIKWSNESKSNLEPIYIKPCQYKILDSSNKILDNKIKVYYLNKEGIIREKILNYLGTIRPNYAQRIANHAFSYPVRVGVDFVKI